MTQFEIHYPPGATPLTPDEREGLIPDYITTHGELNKYIVSFGSENVSVETNGTGLASVRSSLFPETVLVNFSFTDTLGSAKTFINAKGPIPSIRIYKNRNGQGSVYLSSSAKGQKIELKKDKKQIAGYFDVGNANHVSCSGREKLECHEP